MQNLWIASDHAGYEWKERFVSFDHPKLKALQNKIKWVNLGPNTDQSVDYPDFASQACIAAKDAANSAPLAVLICGSGVGMSIAANRYPWVRAVLAFDTEVARLSRQHNQSNFLCLGSRTLPFEKAVNILVAWFETDPDFSERHQNRVTKLSKIKP